MEISKADYLKAKAEALRKLRDDFADAGQLEAKEKAERLLEGLKGEVGDVSTIRIHPDIRTNLIVEGMSVM